MLTTSAGRCVRTCLLALLPVALATTPFAQGAGDKQREALVRQLRRQESLVRSARATFHIVTLPTPADKASRIREACKLTGGDANRYIYTVEKAGEHSFAVRWFRKGVKERLEYSRYRGADSQVSPESAAPILAFDGNMVRRLESDAGGPFGSVDTMKGAHWEFDNRTQPFSFIYEWYGTRFSDVIENSVGAKLSAAARDGREYTEVTVPPKEGDWQTVVLLFDQDNRMVERKVIGKQSDDPKPRLYSKAEFSGYQRHEGPGKEAIWFPHKAVYRYYVHVGDGNIEEYRTETVDIRSIEFNVDIPDETFVPQFPPGTHINDSTGRSIYSLVMGPGQWLKGKPLPALKDFGVKPAGDLAGGKRIAVCFCDLQQRPSRHAVETLAARAELWRQKGLVVVLIVPGGDAGTASANWLKDRKATFAVGRLPADEGQARRILAGWGATALPHIVVTDASHTVTAEAVAADALEVMLKDSTGDIPPAPAATSRPDPTGPTTQPARCLRLILLDDGGKPIEGADVVLGNSSEKENGRPAAVTDSQGRCSIPVGTMQADYWGPKITKSGYVPMEDWLYKTSAEKLFAEDVTLRMLKGQTIGGVVKDESGQPIKDVVLGFHWYSPNRPRQAIRHDMQAKTVQTDKEGRWVCDFAPPELDDNFRIFLRHPQYVSDRWGNGVIPMSRYPRPNQEELLSGKAVYVMKAGLVLAGKVTDIDGKPIRGAQVRLLERDDNRPTNGQRTEADGSFVFKNAERQNDCCVVTAKGFAPEMVSCDPTKSAPLAIALRPGGQIRGRVVDARGIPVPAASFYVALWRGREGYEVLRYSGKTDANACFAWLEAPADGATFTFHKQGYMRQDDVVLKPSDQQQIITLGDPLRVTGRVLDAETGKPIEGARVIQGIDWGQGSAPSWQRQTQTPVKDGKYQMEMDGSYQAYVLRAEADGYKPAVSESIPRDAGRKTVDFKMVKGKPIFGRLLGLDGKPLAGVEVHAATADQRAYIRNGMEFLDRRNAAKVTTAVDGSFSLLPDDKDFTIVVLTDAGYAEVGSADLEKAPEVRLVPWGRIEGVVMQGAKPLPKASVGASAVGSRETPMVYHDLRVTADAHGRFVMPRVPPGQHQVYRIMMMGDVGFYICHEKVTVEAGKTATVTLGGKGRMVVGKLRRDVGDGEMNSANAVILDAASMAIDQMDFRPDNWNKMDSAQRAKWDEQWRQSEEGKAFMRLSQEIREKGKYINAVVYPGGKLEAYDVPPGQYVLNVSLDRVVGGQYVSEGMVKHPFEVPAIKGNDLDTPLDLGVLEVVPPAVTLADRAVAKTPAATASRATSKSPAQAVLNQPLKLDLAADLAGRKLLVVAASIEQRPSRRLLDLLAAQADAVAKQGFAIMLVHPAVTDEAQIKQWLKDHKLDVTQVIIAKDQTDAARLMAACGAEALPFMLLTDDKHVVTALNVQPDKLGRLGDVPAGIQQSTTSPAPSAGRQPTTSPAAAEAGGTK